MRRLLASLGLAMLLAGCASDGGTPADSVPAEPTFDGTYSVRYLPGDGSDTWVARSTCADDRCVATVSIVDPNRTDGVPFRTKVFDYADGRWTAVAADPGTCTPRATGEALNTEVWTAITLTPGDGDMTTGTYDEASAVGACTGERRLELTRVADVNPRIELADPAVQPPYVRSPAVGLRGSYTYRQVHPATGTTFPDEFYGADTRCLRAGDRCQTLLRGADTQVLALTFADGRWTGTTPPLRADCPGVDTARHVTDSAYPMPEPPADPFPAVAGTARQVVTGGCDTSFDLELTLTRTGD